MSKPIGFRVNEQEQQKIDQARVLHGVNDVRTLLFTLIDKCANTVNEPVNTPIEPEVIKVLTPRYSSELTQILTGLTVHNRCTSEEELLLKLIAHSRKNYTIKFPGL